MTTSPDPATPAAEGNGTVYLIHFDKPYKHARHYTGFTTDLDGRLEDHRKGRGARLMEVIKEAGISWRLARTWPGTKGTERAIKNQHNAPRLCPECSPRPQPEVRGHAAEARGRPQVPDRDSVHTSPAAQRHEPAEASPARSPIANGIVPALEPGALSTPWPGRVDGAAARNHYRDLWEITDDLIDGWHAQARAAEPDAELEVG